jgi:hypothetical protein
MNQQNTAKPGSGTSKDTQSGALGTHRVGVTLGPIGARAAVGGAVGAVAGDIAARASAMPVAP